MSLHLVVLLFHRVTSVLFPHHHVSCLLVPAARCDHFRALFESGMRDAGEGELRVPETFSHESMNAFMHYVYKDELPRKLAASQIIQVLHIACYYGVTR